MNRCTLLFSTCSLLVLFTLKALHFYVLVYPKMNIDELPDDIFLLIVKKFSHRFWSTNMFKQNLVLLKVCRKWRGLGLLFTFNHMYITFGQNRKLELDTPNYRKDTVCMLTDTNADIIARAGCTRLVKQIHICVHFINNPFWELGKIVDLLSKSSQSWPTIATLHFSMWSANRQIINNNNVADHALECVQASRALTALLPNIKHADFQGYKPNLYANALYRHIVDCYSETLRVLKSSIAINIQNKLHKIQRVQFPIDAEINYQPPQINTNCVERLVLSRIPFNVQLSDFDLECKSQTIVFSKLKTLEMTYSKNNSSTIETTPRKLHLPNLQTLYIGRYFNNQLMQNIVFPRTMNTISIQGSAPDIESLQNIQFPQTQSFTLCVDSEHNNYSLFKALHRIYDNAGKSTRTELLLATGFSDISPENIRGLNITHLSFLVPVHFDTIVKVVNALPNIVRLDVSWLVMGNIQTDISIPTLENSTRAQSIVSNIKELSLDYVPETQSINLISLVVKFMLLNLQKLSLLDVRLLPEDSIASFIKTYSATYPHLNNIQLLLSKN